METGSSHRHNIFACASLLRHPSKLDRPHPNSNGRRRTVHYHLVSWETVHAQRDARVDARPHNYYLPVDKHSRNLENR